MDISDLDGINTAGQQYNTTSLQIKRKQINLKAFVETLQLTATKHCGDRKNYNDYSITGTYTRTPSVWNKCDKYHINHQVIFSNSLWESWDSC